MGSSKCFHVRKRSSLLETENHGQKVIDYGQVAARAHWVLEFGNYFILGMVLCEWGYCMKFFYVLELKTLGPK